MGSNDPHYLRLLPVYQELVALGQHGEVYSLFSKLYWTENNPAGIAMQKALEKFGHIDPESPHSAMDKEYEEVIAAQEAMDDLR